MAHRSTPPPGERNQAIEAWLRLAARSLTDPSVQLPPPPCDELQDTYAAIRDGRCSVVSAEQQAHSAIEMQSLQMVGSLLAHDLHNLSLRLTLLSQNLERFYGEPSFLQSAKIVLDDTVERMQGLVDGFRERQQSVIVKIRSDVSDILRTAVREAHIEQMPGMELVEDYSAAPLRVWADPFFLSKAFQVIIENAVQAMPQGGRLHVYSGTNGSGVALVQIQDSGMGMTPEFIASELFAPFRTTKGRGLGLGMYVCRHIIRLHGGEILVESDPGRTTLFTLTFPQDKDAP